MPSALPPWEIVAIAGACVSFGLSACIWRINPARNVNRLLAVVILITATWQICYVFRPSSEAGFSLHLIFSSLAALAITVTALLHDAIRFPLGSPADRLRRQKWFLAAGIALFIVPLIPFISLGWPHSYPHGLPSIFWPMHEMAVLGLALVIVYRAMACLRHAHDRERFDAQNFAVLALVLLVVVTLMAMARHFDTATARALISLSGLTFGFYYIVTAWMLTSARPFSFGEFLRMAFDFTCKLSIVFVLVYCCLLWFHGMPPVALAGLIGCFVFLASRHLPSFSREFWRSSAEQPLEATQRQLHALFRHEWSELRLSTQYCDIIGHFLGAGAANLHFSLASLPGDWSPHRRLLVTAACQRGWVTAQSALRTTDHDEAKGYLEAFRAEGLSLVAAFEDDDEKALLFVGERSGLQMTTYNEAAFLIETLGHVLHSRRRIRLAHTALHYDRLAIIGFLASQFRHELRNRLEVVRSGLETLALGEEASLTQEHRDLMLTDLTHLIEDLNLSLDIARASPSRVEPVPARAVVDDAAVAFAPIARRGGIDMVLVFAEDDDAIRVDRRLLRQAILNLLRNASEALTAMERPAITLRVARVDDYVHIDVVDNGPGVPAGIHDRLFVDFNTTKPDGTGLGLSICRDIMIMLNGSITYETAKGQPGACFRLALPSVAGSLPNTDDPSAAEALQWRGTAFVRPDSNEHDSHRGRGIIPAEPCGTPTCRARGPAGDLSRGGGL